MIAIQLTDYFLWGQHHEQTAFSRHNLLLWLAGFILYRLLIQADLPIGSTLPAILLTMSLCAVCHKLLSPEEPVEVEVH